MTAASLLPALLVAAPVCAPKPPRFRADGTFTIVQFTDLHIETDWHPPSVHETVSILEAVLDAEKPDFVAYTGDICEVSSKSCKERANQSAVFHHAFDPSERRGIPWALTLGNWDRKPDANMTGSEIADFLNGTFQHCHNRQAPAGVRGDSVFDVPVMLPNAAEDSTPAAVLYFLDTHMNDGCEGTSGTGCIYASEVDWYNRTSAAYRRANGGRPIPAAAFFHIPLPEHIAAWNEGSAFGRLDEPAWKHGDGVSCVIDSNNFFSTAVANGDIKAMSCGHDHDNDFHSLYQGINLMYGRKTGFGSYGPPKHWGPFPAKDGARVIQLKRDHTGDVTVSTWLRLMDGTRLESRQEGPHTPGERMQFSCNSVSLFALTLFV